MWIETSCSSRNRAAVGDFRMGALREMGHVPSARLHCLTGTRYLAPMDTGDAGQSHSAIVVCVLFGCDCETYQLGFPADFLLYFLLLERPDPSGQITTALQQVRTAACAP